MPVAQFHHVAEICVFGIGLHLFIIRINHITELLVVKMYDVYAHGRGLESLSWNFFYYCIYFLIKFSLTLEGNSMIMGN